LRSCLILLVLLGLGLLGSLLFLPPVQDAVSSARLYLTDDVPPEVTVRVPTETVRGVITASVVIHDPSPYELQALSLDGRPLSPTVGLVLDTASLADGDHALTAVARDLSRRHNATRAAATFRTENTPPTVTVKLDPPAVAQGHTLLVRLALSKPATVTAGYDGAPLAVVGADGLPPSTTATRFCSAGECWALLGFGVEAKAITHTLTFRASDRLGNTSSLTVAFGVTLTKWVVEDIVLPPDKVGLANTSEETSRLNAAFATTSPLPLWQGLFLTPAVGEITAPFGEARSYNGGPVASYHGGVDLAAPADGPVAVAAAGRVLLAEKLTIQGNTVVVDHGLGVVSGYYHLSSIQVKPGDFLQRGRTVGLVGTTGLSTGPHLHWELRFLGTSVDPWEWTKRLVPGP
jgi:murein DD-endopeptidase MepM/ murein hydrolase activator NlpD